jgi:hypothetical protein
MNWNIIDLIIASIPILTGILAIVAMPIYVYYGFLYGKKYGYLNKNKRRLLGNTPLFSIFFGFIGLLGITFKFLDNNYFLNYIEGLKSFF